MKEIRKQGDVGSFNLFEQARSLISVYPVRSHQLLNCNNNKYTCAHSLKMKFLSCFGSLSSDVNCVCSLLVRFLSLYLLSFFVYKNNVSLTNPFREMLKSSDPSSRSSASVEGDRDSLSYIINFCFNESWILLWPRPYYDLIKAFTGKVQC